MLIILQMIYFFLPYAEISTAQADCLFRHSAPHSAWGWAEKPSPCSSTMTYCGSEMSVGAKPRRDEGPQTRASWRGWRRCGSRPGWMCWFPWAVDPSAAMGKATKLRMLYFDTRGDILHSSEETEWKAACFCFTLSFGVMMPLLTSTSHRFLTSLVRRWLFWSVPATQDQWLKAQGNPEIPL